MTVDNAKNIEVAFKKLQSVPLKVGCFAHTLNLAVQKAFADDPIKEIMGKIKLIVTFFHKSSIGLAVLKEKQKISMSHKTNSSQTVKPGGIVPT